MNASQAKTGSRYLSRTGIPVTVRGTSNAKVLLKLATTGSVIRVNSDYELKPAKGNDSGHEVESISKTPRRANYGTRKPMTLAFIIDPMLLAGGHTVKEIALELGKRAGEVAQGKDLEANVRARMVGYRRKGWQVLKDGKQVQVCRI